MHLLLFQVHIYVDAVVNHMCGAAGGSGTHSTCGSYFDAGNRDFPAVPYSGWDFNDGKCQTGSGEIENYGDIYQVTFSGKSLKSLFIIFFFNLFHKRYSKSKRGSFSQNLCLVICQVTEIVKIGTGGVLMMQNIFSTEKSRTLPHVSHWHVCRQFAPELSPVYSAQLVSSFL